MVLAVVLAVVVAGVAVLVGSPSKGGRDDTATPSSTAPAPTDSDEAATITEAMTTTTTVATTATEAPTTTTTSPLVSVLAGGDAATVDAVASSLTTYFSAINAHDFPTAYAMLGPTAQGRVSLDEMARDASTSHDEQIVLESVFSDGAGGQIAIVSFTSTQAPEDSPTSSTCNRWRIRYELVASGGSWLIDRSSGVDGAKPYSSC